MPSCAGAAADCGRGSGVVGETSEDFAAGFVGLLQISFRTQILAPAELTVAVAELAIFRPLNLTCMANTPGGRRGLRERTQGGGQATSDY